MAVKIHKAPFPTNQAEKIARTATNGDEETKSSLPTDPKFGSRLEELKGAKVKFVA